MSKTVLQEIKEEMNSLRSSANGWKTLANFFETNKRIKPYYDEVVEECRRDNYFGMATMMVLTIEKLLEKVEDSDDEIKFLQDKDELSYIANKES